MRARHCAIARQAGPWSTSSRVPRRPRRRCRARRDRGADLGRGGDGLAVHTTGNTRGGRWWRNGRTGRSGTCTCGRWAGENFTEFVRGFYPVVNRQGLINRRPPTTAAGGTSTRGSWASSCARRGSSGTSGRAIRRRGTCSSPSAATWPRCAMSFHGERRRGVQRGVQAAGAGQSDRHADLGREIWLSFVERAGGQGDRDGRGERGVWARGSRG